MAIYHFSAQIIKRSDGRSSVAAAAYRAAAILLDERTGTAHDFTKKRGVFHTAILLPDAAPAAFSDRATLWNAVEKKETRKNSQTAREIDFALPSELSHEQKKALAIDFIKATFVDVGMCADVALHDFESDNPHAHVMLTTREVDASGFTVKNRNWNDRDTLKKWREQWQEHANAALEKAGFDARIDHRTLEAQGIDREPQVHLGAARSAMLKKGKSVDSIEPQLERQRLKRAAQQAANDKIKDAQLYAQSEDIQNELEQLEHQLREERERAHEQRQLEARISAVRVAIAAENAEQQRLTDSITRAQSEHQQLAAKVAELEQHVTLTASAIRSREATNIKTLHALRAAKEHIQQAQAEQQRLEQSIRDAKQRLESTTKPNLVQLLSDYIKSGLALNTADYDNDTYLFMRDLLDFYEIEQQLSDSELRQLVDSSITSLDALIDDLVTATNKNNISPSQRF